MDDGLTAQYHPLALDIFNNRKNPNGCPISSTFFISGDWGDDFSFAKDMEDRGNFLLIKFFVMDN